VPVFVITHHAREPVEMQGGTTFHFVTEGIEAGLKLATEAGGGKDVWLTGGASVIRQYLRAGLLDEIEISLAPVLLGEGEQLFGDLDGSQIELEQSARSRRRASPTSSTASNEAAERSW
jgi:dihydrofolate reductase